jgi:HSP20 family protein
MAFRDLIPWSRHENRLPIRANTDRARDEHPLLSLHREVNRLFDDVFRGFDLPAFSGFGGGVAWPNLELSESDREIRISAELPGLNQKDVELSIADGVLTLRGEKKMETKDAERGYSERSYGRFERRIALPRDIEADKASASFNDGVLLITLPKSAAANENVHRIPINSQAA